MLRVKDNAVLDRIAVLEQGIVDNDTNAQAEAQKVANVLGYDADKTAKLKDFILATDERFNIEKNQQELDYLKGFCEEYEPEEDAAESTEEVQNID